MNMQQMPAPGTRPASQLWLMLPGAYMAPADFVAAGFVEAIHRRGLTHDVALLDANVAEVADGSALLFLQQYLNDVPQDPARRITLLGISLGAHLALACLARASSGVFAARAAARVHSACLLAPYLGPRDVVAEVASAGALHPWQPAEGLAPDDIDRSIWRWLQQQSGLAPALYLGYGSEDRFAKAHALMAQALPASHVDVLPGGHVWPVWTTLWQRHLDQFHVS